MARKKKALSAQPTLDELAELADKVGIAPDALEGDIRDAAEDEVDLIVENLVSGTQRERLEFLYLHGFDLNRLRDIILETAGEDAADEGGGP